MLTERDAIVEFLETYKCLPCLWDVSDKLYTNREARDQAHEILLEKFKRFYADATVETMKKRIENMRACYKREVKKVLNNHSYIPSLWYYKHMCFLDNHEYTEDTLIKKYDSNGEDDTSAADFEDQPPSPPPKPRSSKRKKSDNNVYIIKKDDSFDPLNATALEDVDCLSTQEDTNLEAVSFGKTLGYQLQQLDQQQRTIAEKLISDVIFYARQDKLTFETAVVINDPFQS